MFLNATIYLDERKAWTLPEQAVVRYGGKSYVFRQAGAGRFEMVEVQSSAAGNGRLVIESPELDPSIEVFALKNAYALLGKLKNSAEED
jgi:cobalt-zinc-cadmium efflux system membrane fusion protein